MRTDRVSRRKFLGGSMATALTLVPRRVVGGPGKAPAGKRTSQPAAGATPVRPDILFIMPDQMRGD